MHLKLLTLLEDDFGAFLEVDIDAPLHGVIFEPGAFNVFDEHLERGSDGGCQACGKVLALRETDDHLHEMVSDHGVFRDPEVGPDSLIRIEGLSIIK